MLPEMSTDSIKSRPVDGSCTGSPSHCGRLEAIITSNQIAVQQTRFNNLPEVMFSLSDCKRLRVLKKGTYNAAS